MIYYLLTIIHETERQRDRERERERETEKEKERKKERKKERRKEGKKERKKERRKEGKKERRKEGKKERRKEGKKERRKDRQKERKAEKSEGMGDKEVPLTETTQRKNRNGDREVRREVGNRQRRHVGKQMGGKKNPSLRAPRKTIGSEIEPRQQVGGHKGRSTETDGKQGELCGPKARRQKNSIEQQQIERKQVWDNKGTNQKLLHLNLFLAVQWSKQRHLQGFNVWPCALVCSSMGSEGKT